ncbi:alcohol dehydrogenase [Nocardia farcinica]|uniref:alcohol dehydrogenase n=1 Tax=Nocardia farcinica TaxID=37329 RepID=UPI0018943682|nr:alcohol dehydrogenase [Nocardia farcinica]MBF6271635.1 alcohol dehydrogenase catalytic domain-containing protein [Nocardia farcinica]MCZ9330356.1 alcohol dehydrogenase [Nocardia farcinica]
MASYRTQSIQLHNFGTPPTLTQHEVDAPTGSEVLVRVTGAGVCHSDLHIQDGYYDLGGGEHLSFKQRVTFPVTPGHEISGVVVARGEDVTDVTIGQNVLVCPWVGCGDCPRCARGNENLCSNPQFLGVNRDGGYAEHVLVPHSRYLIDLGDLDPARAAPLTCSGLTTYSAIGKFGNDVDKEPLVIFGAGGLGLMAVGLLAIMGKTRPVVVEIDPERRSAALAAGARAAIDPTDSDADEQIRAAVGGPVLAILDVVGAGATFAQAYRLIEKGGRIVIAGLLGGDIRLQVPLIPMRSISIEGSYVGTLDELRELVTLVRTHGLPDIPVHTRELHEAPQAMEELRSGSVVGRLVLTP